MFNGDLFFTSVNSNPEDCKEPFSATFCRGGVGIRFFWGKL